MVELRRASCGCCLEIIGGRNTVATIYDPEQFMVWIGQYDDVFRINEDVEKIIPPVGMEIDG